MSRVREGGLYRDESFSAWMKKFAQAWGSFLDTPESASGIGSFLTQPNYHIDDYFVGPSGWLTFNQFFAGEVKPGRRPVAEPRTSVDISTNTNGSATPPWES